jgi:Tfp pilus assembly protein PilF
MRTGHPHSYPVSLIALVAASLTACATTGGAGRADGNEKRASLMVAAALGALNENDAVGALQMLAEAERIEPDRADVHTARMMAFAAKGEPEEALASARRAHELAPEVPENQNNLGKHLVDAGKYEEAVPLLEKAAANHLYAESFKASTNLGIIHYRRGEDTAARARLEKAVRQAPNEACVAHYYLGHIELRAGRFDAAIGSYDRATRQLCASFSDAHYALGLAYERSRQYERARRKFLDISTLFPNSQVARRAMERLNRMP